MQAQKKWKVAGSEAEVLARTGPVLLPHSEEVPLPTISAITVGNRGHLFKGGFFSIEITSTRFSLLH
jgi:hypothetical protein